MKLPTTPEDRKRIAAMFDGIAEFIGYLAARWADEREYEDIAEYQTAIEKRMPEGFTVVRMTKRPFGFEFSIGTDARYALQAYAQRIALKQTK